MANEHDIWLKKAEEDLDTAKYNIEGRKFSAGLFFLQQSAEKALKALHIKKFKELLKTHDLVVLANKLKAPSIISGFCKKLTPAYQYTKYPDTSQALDQENRAIEFIKYSEEVIRWVKERL